MKNIGLSIFIAILGVAMLNAQSAPAFEARLVIRSGLVEVQRGNGWVPIAAGDLLKAGDRIRTVSGSIAAIEIGPGKVVTLNEQSQVQLGESTASPAVRLESGSMKVFSASDIQVSAKDTVLQSVDRPLDLELGYQADKLNVTVFNGAVLSGPIIIRGLNEDPTVRTHRADGRLRDYGTPVANPTYYVFPYFLYGNLNPDPTGGAIVPPVVNNPTNPGYRPTQVVAPMSDPIRVPVRRQ